MGRAKRVGKRDFIQHTSKYLKIAEESGGIVITHREQPQLQVVRIKRKSVTDLKGLLPYVKIKGDINDPVLEGYDKW